MNQSIFSAQLSPVICCIEVGYTFDKICANQRNASDNVRIKVKCSHSPQSNIHFTIWGDSKKICFWTQFNGPLTHLILSSHSPFFMQKYF